MANVPNDLPIKAVAPSPAPAAPRAKPAPAAPAPQGDVVEISPRAKEASRLFVKLEALPEVRPEAVASAKPRVSPSGPAPVAAAALAEKLLTEN